MPYYQIHTSIFISPAQLDEFAARLTVLHCSTFSAPSIFVNISFLNDNIHKTVNYVGGKRQEQQNYIIGHIRPRPASARSKVQDLVKGIMTLWDEMMRPGERSASGRLDDEKALHNVFIMEDITAGAEQGFILPIAGQDAVWMEENRAEFERRASHGDESMQTLLTEIENRKKSL